jgi:hypothetical protein
VNVFRLAGFREKAKNLAADDCLSVDWIRTPDNQRPADESIKRRVGDLEGCLLTERSIKKSLKKLCP